ncbi:MAG: hypothetical protein Q8O56_09705 [Solirubrobacteraceae bacterium]|nr:hypothetical protein [Solirubrobacteraceae bacterium]
MIVTLAASGAVAVAVAAAPRSATPSGVGAVKLGKTYTALRAGGHLGKLRPGCELAGPGTRSASLRAPLRGSVDLTRRAPRKVATIVIRGGAAARGVRIGSTSAAIRRAFPAARFDHSTDATFAITLVRVPRQGGGRIEFAVDTTTKRVTLIGIPRIPFCE